ncbi:Conserved hypothetical protein [Clostridium acetobutylicum EA 2018]|uniref:Uncharacterized protein n=1 Tax=Clostridium acetobutylicum (strain ATCC 824 / DSM 792 / JCM 1419 / IAM 19013 / LMG 5710 / NBRC 13948 / NRRL B-527 / VKM B-1787 / 2291 / W) TaxID=272562 RepID=Q97FM1_CLOAB|nr:Hypothetical protein CA_C2715 [Clostridium acetobutylicum ATCC 824]ADZ21761.1 Conserved hypothetical protein [Clostridium acetobutylicum EA 2018]AEI32513.1 hypothetical protein SMB_G2750 [Clostridium acetobutylicum DSM 1731]
MTRHHGNSYFIISLIYFTGKYFCFLIFTHIILYSLFCFKFKNFFCPFSVTTSFSKDISYFFYVL